MQTAMGRTDASGVKLSHALSESFKLSWRPHLQIEMRARHNRALVNRAILRKQAWKKALAVPNNRLNAERAVVSGFFGRINCRRRSWDNGRCEALTPFEKACCQTTARR